MDLEANLAGESGEVTRLPQQDRIRPIHKPPLQIAMPEIAAVPILIQPGHQAASASHADRGGVVMIGETHTIARQPVDIRRLNLRIAIAPHGPRRLVVGQQEDNVRLLRRAEQATRKPALQDKRHDGKDEASDSTLGMEQSLHAFFSFLLLLALGALSSCWPLVPVGSIRFRSFSSGLPPNCFQ